MKTKKLLKQICAVLLGLVLSVSQIPVTGYIPVSAEEIVATLTASDGTLIGSYASFNLAVINMLSYSGSTVTLQKDVRDSGVSFNNSSDVLKTYTIDLNGYGILKETAVNPNNPIVWVTSGYTVNIVDSKTDRPDHYIRLENGRGVEVSDSVFNGTEGSDYIKVAGGYITGAQVGVIVDGGVLNLKNVNIVGNVNDQGFGNFIFGGGVKASNGASVTMESGKISNNTATYGGGVYVEESSFTMTGGEISNNTAKAGGGVYVWHNLNASDKNATFTMTGGKISGNKAEQSSSSNSGVGGGVYVERAAFNMTNGTISGNTANNGGGGIYGKDDASITIGDATIGGTASEGNTATIGGTASEGNTATKGGGVYVNHATFTMKDGTISGNTANNGGGGIYGINGASITMEDGIIGGATDGAVSKGNSSLYEYGGGVCVNNAAFTMKDGTISGNTANYAGGGIYGEKSSVTIEDGTISKNTITDTNNSAGGGVLIDDNSTLTMKNGTISQNTAKSGGGVFVINSDFDMQGGKITNNTALSGYGGGVNVRKNINRDGNATFTMKDGEIAENTALEGGGVCGYGANIIMEGGEISQNTAKSGGGVFVALIPGVSNTNDTFKMTGGKITGNKAEYDANNRYSGLGGGVRGAGGSIIKMEDGEISENIALNGGGVFIKDDDTEFAMSGGKITGNEAVYNENLQTLLSGGEGGGVTVSDSATFTMTGGEITENAAGRGGGVNVGYSPIGQASATFKMTAGKISKNTAEVYGGVYVGGVITVSSGVAVISSCFSTFIMEGGEISGNSAKDRSGGVFVYGSILKIIGNVSIKDNKLIKTDDPEEDSNLLVGAECEFSISGELTGNIGASLKKLDVDLSEYFLTTGELATAEGSYNISADDAKVFTSDNKYYTVVLKDDGKLHYEKSFVVAEIPAMRYTEEALVPDVSVSGISGELTENTDYTVTISQSGEATTPVNPGKYSVEVTGTGVEYYGTVTTEFEVKKRENKITKVPVANNFVADGTEKALASAGEAAYGDIVYAVTEATDATTKPSKPADGAFTINIPTVKEAGTYCLWYMAKEDEFNEGTNADCLLVTVSKPTPVSGEDNSESGEDNNLINGGENNTEVDGNNNSVNGETNDTVNQGNNDSKDVENKNSENGESVDPENKNNNNTSENGEGNKTDQTDDDDNNGYSSGNYSSSGYVNKPVNNDYAIVYNTSVADKKDESKDGDSKDNAGKDNTGKDNDKPKDQNQVGNNEPQVTEVVSNDGKSETVERIISYENGDKLQESTTVKETKKGTVTVAESKLTNEAGVVIEESKSKIRENDDVTISSSKTVNYESGVVESTYQKNSENVSIDRVKQTDLNGNLIQKTEEVVKQLDNRVQTKDTVWKANGSMKSETKTEYKDGTELHAKYIQEANGKGNYSRVMTDANGDVISELACKVSAKGNATITTKTADADGNLVIPNTLKINGDKHPVTGVAANAFANNTDITSAVIGANVTKIGDGAFAGAINLEKITFKGKTVDIGEDAFKGVNNLTVDVQLKNDVATSEEIKNLINKLVEEIMGKSYGW